MVMSAFVDHAAYSPMGFLQKCSHLYLFGFLPLVLMSYIDLGTSLSPTVSKMALVVAHVLLATSDLILKSSQLDRAQQAVFTHRFLPF